MIFEDEYNEVTDRFLGNKKKKVVVVVDLQVVHAELEPVAAVLLLPTPGFVSAGATCRAMICPCEIALCNSLLTRAWKIATSELIYATAASGMAKSQSIGTNEQGRNQSI
jgi:UPF0716 family protein affecting phage T7 exclusion